MCPFKTSLHFAQLCNHNKEIINSFIANKYEQIYIVAKLIFFNQQSIYLNNITANFLFT